MSNNTKNIVRLLLLFPLFVAPLGIAQDEPAGARDEAASDETTENPPAATTGDVIHLKSGTTMSGVQVLRSSPMYIYVQLVEGVDPLQIPRTQVDHVDYDDIDPARERLRRKIFPEQEEVSLASGERVSRALMEKLSAPVSDKPLKYQRKDLIEVLQEVAKSMDVKLKINKSIRDKEKRLRLWTLETTPETTLMSLLREELVGQFNYAEVIFQVDTIVVMTKQAAKKQRQKEAGGSQ